ncbi:hypothetical protein [Schaedlerella arabinosiphila]|nr:hypothetical protein [Schaedlerella arabinosiphila]KAI4443330.1 hypothetical protein C824_005865 [Schaedlerella arabinosiphila]
MIVLEEKNGRGRSPHKPNYSPEELMAERLDAVVEVYMKLREIKATALELDLPPNKVKKLLITAKVLSYPETGEIQRLLNSGKTMAEVQEAMRLSHAAINTYLPYSKCVYKTAEISQNAERMARYRERKAAVQSLRSIIEDGGTTGEMEQNLWNCVVAFQQYPFHTSSGLTFSYSLKTGRNGAYTKELFIAPQENSKPLAWSSVQLVFFKAIEKRDTVFDRPKAVGNIRGISYIYSLFCRFGVIKVPGEVEERMRSIHESN